MICPECETEYLNDIKICADCKVTLVDAEPLHLPLPKIKWVPLPTLEGNIYAQMVVEVLEGQNIPAYIKSDFFTSAFSMSSTNLPGTKVIIYVPEEHKDAAHKILIDMMG